MRVIAGQFKGRPLKAPKGMNTRPTTDRVKETLMSKINSQMGSFEDLCVLDAFAGSGALGIEALSRGAKCCHFFERDRNALEALQSNIDLVGLDSRTARVFKSDILKNPPLFGAVQYDLVFLDPPYAYDAQVIFDFIDKLKDAQRLSEDCLISYEHSSAVDLSSELEARGSSMMVTTGKRFGDTTIDLLSYPAE